MVGVPIDLLWFESLGIIMGEDNKKMAVPKSEGMSSREEDQKNEEKYNRVLWRPHNPWSLP